MAKTIFLFYTICKDPSRDKELSDWYDKIHIPDVEAIPGFTSCIRYKLTDSQMSPDRPQQQDIKATYLSIVEAEVDVDTAIANLQKASASWRERGRIGQGAGDLFQVVSSKIITETNPSHRKGARVPRLAKA